jgi:hypothetical protein
MKRATACGLHRSIAIKIRMPFVARLEKVFKDIEPVVNDTYSGTKCLN